MDGYTSNLRAPFSPNEKQGVPLAEGAWCPGSPHSEPLIVQGCRCIPMAVIEYTFATAGGVLLLA